MRWVFLLVPPTPPQHPTPQPPPPPPRPCGVARLADRRPSFLGIWTPFWAGGCGYGCGCGCGYERMHWTAPYCTALHGTPLHHAAHAAMEDAPLHSRPCHASPASVPRWIATNLPSGAAITRAIPAPVSRTPALAHMAGNPA